MRTLLPIFLLLLAGCGLKNTWLLANCGRTVLAALGPSAPAPLTADSCRHEVACDVRVFDPTGEDSSGQGFASSVSVDDAPVSITLFRYNTFGAMKDAADPSEYDRTEVACYFASSPLRVDKSGHDYSQTLSAAVGEIRSRCLSGVSP